MHEHACLNLENAFTFTLIRLDGKKIKFLCVNLHEVDWFFSTQLSLEYCLGKLQLFVMKADWLRGFYIEVERYLAETSSILDE
jgi:hypothetical protein